MKCRATQINDRLFVTAAHCIQDKGRQQITKPSEIIVQLGRHDIKATSEPGSTERSVNRIDINPRWDSSSERWDSDIALIYMSELVTFTDKIVPVCVANDSSAQQVKSGYVVSVHVIQCPPLDL